MNNCFFKKYSINLRGRLVEMAHPWVMGILNATPDSFYSDSRVMDAEAIAERALAMVADGADILDIGACSTRPGAENVGLAEEVKRLDVAVRAVRAAVGPSVVISVDTFRAQVAKHCVEELGVDIVNDISGGDLDPLMHNTIAQLQVPYIVMHTRGTPATMQQLTNYDGDVAAVVLEELARKIDTLHQLGINDVIADPVDDTKGAQLHRCRCAQWHHGGQHHCTDEGRPHRAGSRRESGSRSPRLGHRCPDRKLDKTLNS